jgi:hypothetical protein
MSAGALRSRAPRWPWALYALLALAVLLWAAPRTSLYKRSLLPEMVAGTAWRPYVKRVLVPLVVRGADALLPAGARAGLGELVSGRPSLAARLGWQSAHASWYALVFLLHGLSLFLFALAFRRLAARTLGLDPVRASLAAAGALALVPIHFGYQNYLYDFPGLALFTLGLVLVAERRWGLFYLLWPVGLLNKETFVLLTPVFVLSARARMPWRRLLVHAGAQLATAVGLWLALGWVFRGNPGAPVEWHLLRNLTHAPLPRQLLHDAVYWGAWVCGLLSWHRQRALAAQALAVGGVLVGTTLFLGFLGEYRDFYEVWPLLALLLAATALRLPAGRPPAAAAPEDRQAPPTRPAASPAPKRATPVAPRRNRA